MDPESAIVWVTGPGVLYALVKGKVFTRTLLEGYKYQVMSGNCVKGSSGEVYRVFVVGEGEEQVGRMTSFCFKHIKIKRVFRFLLKGNFRFQGTQQQHLQAS